MKLKIGEEHVIARGCRPEEIPWGAWQFPQPYKDGERLIVSVHVSDDDIKSFGNPQKWYESRDNGVSWKEITPENPVRFGTVLPSGDRIYFPPQSAVSLKDYKMPDWGMLTPAYDFTKQAREGELPLPDGMTYWLDGTVIKAYKAERMPESLAKKEWQMERLLRGSEKIVTEDVPVDWPYLTRVVFTNTFDNDMKTIYPKGKIKIAPDGSTWVSSYSGEGHINPQTRLYSPYYSAELFRSDDNAHSFKQVSHMEYEADGHEYPYQSGGFSDSDFEFMDDGSIIWVLRSAWAMYTGREWDPMYISRSEDMGKTWSKPVKFAHTGIYPRMCKLGCGAVLLCYARPGMFVTACDDGKGIDWCEPLMLMTDGDRSGLHNLKITNPTFHQWDGSCNNPTMIAIDDNTAMIFYSDFYYPDDEDVKRKTILCRTIMVERD